MPFSRSIRYNRIIKGKIPKNDDSHYTVQDEARGLPLLFSESKSYLIQCAHPSDGANVVGDGDQCGPGEVFLADGLSLFFTHHVAKASWRYQ